MISTKEHFCIYSYFKFTHSQLSHYHFRRRYVNIVINGKYPTLTRWTIRSIICSCNHLLRLLDRSTGVNILQLTRNTTIDKSMTQPICKKSTFFFKKSFSFHHSAPLFPSSVFHRKTVQADIILAMRFLVQLVFPLGRNRLLPVCSTKNNKKIKETGTNSIILVKTIFDQHITYCHALKQHLHALRLSNLLGTHRSVYQRGVMMDCMHP